MQQAATQIELDTDRKHITADYLHVEAGQIQLLYQQQRLRAGWAQLAASRRQAEAANAAELAQIQAARDALAAETAARNGQLAKLSILSSQYACPSVGCV